MRKMVFMTLCVCNIIQVNNLSGFKPSNGGSQEKKIITHSIPCIDQILNVHLGIHILNCGCILLCGDFYLIISVST